MSKPVPEGLAQRRRRTGAIGMQLRARTVQRQLARRGSTGQQTAGGRTLAQGALAYLWARSDRVVPIPGYRTVAQAEENASAMAYGPLTADELSEVERLLGRPDRQPVASAPAPD